MNIYYKDCGPVCVNSELFSVVQHRDTETDVIVAPWSYYIGDFDMRHFKQVNWTNGRGIYNLTHKKMNS